MSKLQRYSSYKESGIEWLDDIPEHWEVKRLGTLGVFSASGIDKYINKNESKVKIINFTDVYSNTKKVLNNNIQYMQVTTPEANRKKHLVKKGDLIFLPSSETYEDLGYSALVDEELNNTSFSYHVIRLEFKQDIEHNFRKYLTNNNIVLNQFSSYGKGTTRKIIGRSVFKNIRVVIPPKDEQTAIASFLDDKTAQIDQAISQKEKMIELLKERRQIVINEAVTRGINPNAPMKESGVEWIGEIPEHWEIVKNRILFVERKEAGMEGLPILMVSIHTAVSTDEIDEELNIRGKIRIEDKSSYKLVKPTDIVFNMMRAWQGSIGAVRTLGMVSPAYVVAKTDDKLNADFFEFQYRTQNFIQQMDKASKGITDFRKRLYWDEFKQLNTILPPLQEQQIIVNYIEEQTSKIDTAIELQQNYIAKLKEYKTTLIDSVVTGKVKVA